jgi:hypothetical protein
MRLTNRLYSLALRAYPRDFRDDYRDEVLGTLADLRDAREGKGVLRQTLSLGYNGNRLRWMHATGGSVAQTFRQGLAWGVLILIARQAGLGLQEVFKGWFYPFGDPSLATIALTVGWLLVFGLLVTGHRTWGLAVLSAVIAGFVAERVAFKLSYGGPLSWPFTLRYFLSTTLALLFAYLRPAREVRLPLRLGAALLILAAAVPPLSMLFNPALIDVFPGLNPQAANLVYWAIQFACYVMLGGFVLLASLSDPRWAVTTTLLVFVQLIQEFISELGSVSGFAGYSGVLMLAIMLPAGAALLSFWARRRALPWRAR